MQLLTSRKVRDHMAISCSMFVCHSIKPGTPHKAGSVIIVPLNCAEMQIR